MALSQVLEAQDLAEQMSSTAPACQELCKQQRVVVHRPQAVGPLRAVAELLRPPCYWLRVVVPLVVLQAAVPLLRPSY